MEKKQKKEYILITIFSTIIVMLFVSIFFSRSISANISNWLGEQDIYVSEDDILVHFISVGQGDAIAIRFDNGEVMLIDAGPKSAQNDLVQYVEQEVLNSNTQSTIDYLILTHPDTDHSGGICALFSKFNVKHFYRPNIASSSDKQTDFPLTSNVEEYNQAIISSQNESGIDINVINKEYQINIGESLVQIFPPINIYSTTNEMSPIIKVSKGNKSILFTGDISSEVEYDMIQRYGDKLKADVLKVAHHGSSGSSSSQFIDLVSPKYAVVCVGSNNYGHPSLSVMARLEDNGAKVYTTLNNHVRIVCNQDRLDVLSKDTTHSFEYIHWCLIAALIILVLVIYTTKSILKLIKLKQNEKLEDL